MPPKVSVIVPAFNAERSIDAALESVFAQTFTDYEVVVVDDGSTDRTADRLAAWRDRVRAFWQPNAGPAAARNRAIRESRGEFLAFLDADDTWLPTKLALQVEYFARYPQTGLLHTAALTGDPGNAGDVPEPAASDPAPPRGAFCDLFHTDLDVNTLTVMVPRRIVDTVGMFDERREIHVEDWDLWLRIAARYPIGYLPRTTALRRPGGVMSRAFEKTFAGQAAVVEKMADVCETACPLHARVRRACLRRRWHRLHWELGYARQRAGDAAGARQAFLAALRHEPRHLGTYMHLAGTFVGPRLRRLARRFRPSPAILGPSRGPVLPQGTGSAFAVRGDATAKPSDAGDEGPGVGRSLVYDTLYRRARHAVAEGLHDVDDFLTRRGDRRKILFEAASPMSFVVFKPVYERLRGDDRLEFWFTATGSWDAAQLYAQVGVHDHVVSSRAAAWMKVDACINTDFWDATWLHRRTRRVHLFHGVAGKYGLDAPVAFGPAVAIYDRLLFPNRDRLERYVDAGLVEAGGRTGALVGYPKVDRLVDGSLDLHDIVSGLGFGSRSRTVMYAPTWSPHSSLHVMGEPLVQALAAAGFNVIVKLHDRSYDRSSRGSGGIDWGSRFAAYAGHPRIRLVRDPDATPFLAVSDAIITDHSSIGFEFALLDRPIVVLDCPDLIAHAAVTASKVSALRAAAEVTDSVSGAISALCRQFDNPWLHRAERQSLAETYFYRPGTASHRAAAVVYDVLALAAPSELPAPDAETDSVPSVVRG